MFMESTGVRLRNEGEQRNASFFTCMTEIAKLSTGRGPNCLSFDPDGPHRTPPCLFLSHCWCSSLDLLSFRYAFSLCLNIVESS